MVQKRIDQTAKHGDAVSMKILADRTGREKEIELRLKQYAVSCRRLLTDEAGQEKALEQTRKERNISELLRVKPLPRTRGNLWDFVLEQMGYLGRYCLIWQAAWAALFYFMMHYGGQYLYLGSSGNEFLVLLSLLPPLLVLVTIEEITKIYQRSMLEIEHVTKYSLRNVVLIRMLILGVVHSVFLTVGIIHLHGGIDSDIRKLLVYGFTPMIIMTGALMKLMEYLQGEKLMAAGIALYAAIVIIAVVGNSRRFEWYHPYHFHIWCMACVVSLFFAVSQFFFLGRKLSRIEQIVQ